MNNQTTYPGYPQGNPDHLFPEIYRVMQPAIQSTLDVWVSQSQTPESLTPSHLDHMVSQVLQISGLDAEQDEAIMAMAPPRNRYRPSYRPRFNSSDLAKILLLQEFFRRYGYYPPYAPYSYPYYY